MAGLQVDGEHVSGAPRLYESLGFGVRRSWVSRARLLPPLAA